MKHQTSTVKLLLQIFFTFFKISPVTFGGGYAMIPLIEREVVDRRKWVQTREITDIFAMSGSVPGAIAINSATFVGYRVAGVLGAIVATIGIMIPTFMIMVLLSLFFLSVQDHPMVEAAFMSIRATIVAMITYAAYKIGRTALIDKTTMVLTIGSVLVLWFMHLHPVLLVIVGAILGILIVSVKKSLGMKTTLEHEEAEEYVYQDYYIGDGI